MRVQQKRWLLYFANSSQDQPTDRENVLLTTMPEQDVRSRFKLARADYMATSGRDRGGRLAQAERRLERAP